LEFFDAFDMGDHIEVQWAASFEKNNLGWNLYRAKKGDGYEQLNDDPIPAYQYDYQYYDFAALDGQTYCYKVESVDLTGRIRIFGPACVNYGSSGGREFSLKNGGETDGANEGFGADEDRALGCAF